ncbi:hypothetical protein [Gordonia humi]|uniref:Uncharacterized protein n=1 Tax=Gordonia humi TaxID=686429 RepID=A0A840F348_9ACTN|nr:hypothetical protein [Gordonia humi]
MAQPVDEPEENRVGRRTAHDLVEVLANGAASTDPPAMVSVLLTAAGTAEIVADTGALGAERCSVLCRWAG